MSSMAFLGSAPPSSTIGETCLERKLIASPSGTTRSLAWGGTELRYFDVQSTRTPFGLTAELRAKNSFPPELTLWVCSNRNALDRAITPEQNSVRISRTPVAAAKRPLRPGPAQAGT